MFECEREYFSFRAETDSTVIRSVFKKKKKKIEKMIEFNARRRTNKPSFKGSPDITKFSICRGNVGGRHSWRNFFHPWRLRLSERITLATWREEVMENFPPKRQVSSDIQTRREKSVSPWHLNRQKPRFRALLLFALPSAKLREHIYWHFTRNLYADRFSLIP